MFDKKPKITSKKSEDVLSSENGVPGPGNEAKEQKDAPGHVEPKKISGVHCNCLKQKISPATKKNGSCPYCGGVVVG